MNDYLVQTLRNQLANQSDEELLRVWVENNRLHWSAEYFEAVRQLLAGRGLAVPAQQAPPVPAHPVPRTAEPAIQYWLDWLKPVLLIGVGLGAVGAAAGGATLLSLVGFTGSSFSAMGSSREALFFGAFLVDAALSVLLLVGAAGALRQLSPTSRRCLIVYAWLTIAVTALALVAGMVQRALSWSFWGFAFWYSQLENAQHLAQRAVFPLVILWLMSRPPIRALFAPHFVGHGFEPALTTPRSSPPADEGVAAVTLDHAR